MTNINSIFIRRKNKIVVPFGRSKLAASTVATFNANLASLGYTCSDLVLQAVAKLDLTTLTAFYKDLVEILQELKGVKRYKPMYPNFPEQVMNASEAELYLNAIAHYITVWISDILQDDSRSLVYLPKYKKEKRAPLADDVKLTVLDLGTADEFHKMFTMIVAANTSISETDKEDLKWYCKHHPLVLPEQIPQKEILAFVGSLIPTNPGLKKHFKVATDVLRLAVAMSEGDVSLAKETKFRKFSRKERKALLSLLENTGGSKTEDMLVWKERWKRLGERLHPGEFGIRFPHSLQSFNVLRQDQPFLTFNSKVEAAIASKDISTATKLLASKPGVFARKLDHLLRIENKPTIGRVFNKVADKVSTPVLLQVMAHFTARKSPAALRTFFPKGSVAKAQVIENNLPALPVRRCTQIADICEEHLEARFASMPRLKKVFVDERLKEYLVPFSQRSASKSLRTLVRGSRIPFDDGTSEANTIRFFLWWKEGKNRKGEDTGRVDIDLSGMFYSEDWQLMTYITYYNLRSSEYQAAHSGDITTAPKGACEFIDLHLPSALHYGARYAVMNLNSFTQQNFSDLPECFAGWMLRQAPKSGEIFEAKTVKDKIDLTSESKMCIPCILDLKERKVIWVDMDLRPNRRSVINVAGNSDNLALMARSLTEIPKPTLYDLFRIHGQARGKLVSKKEKADVIFSPDPEEATVSPFDMERIMSEFLK